MNSRVLARLSFSLSLFTSACSDTPLTSEGSSVADDVDESDLGDQGHDDGGEIPADYRTFFIGESTKFDGGGLCESPDLNTVTGTLRKRLDDAGWSGLRFLDDNSWPEDFQESQLISQALAARGETPRAASLGLSAEGGVAETRSTPGTTSFRLLPLDENPGARRHVGFHHGLLDGNYGDAATLAVYAGHGNVGYLQWGRPLPMEPVMSSFVHKCG